MSNLVAYDVSQIIEQADILCKEEKALLWSQDIIQILFDASHWIVCWLLSINDVKVKCGKFHFRMQSCGGFDQTPKCLQKRWMCLLMVCRKTAQFQFPFCVKGCGQGQSRSARERIILRTEKCLGNRIRFMLKVIFGTKKDLKNQISGFGCVCVCVRSTQKKNKLLALTVVAKKHYTSSHLRFKCECEQRGKTNKKKKKLGIKKSSNLPNCSCPT